MSFIGILLLVLFIYFIIKPIIKIAVAYYKLRHGDMSVLGDLFGQPGAQKRTTNRNPDGSRKAGWTKPRFKKKKISADTGEYVKFTEVETSEQAVSDGAGNVEYTSEQQVTDVEWEDVV